MWEKLGVIFVADGQLSWMNSYAYVPTAIRLDHDRIRVFLAFRDFEDVGRIGWIDVSAQDPTRLLSFSQRPALDIGVPGGFDDNGVTPLSVVKDGEALRLYYAGWQLTPRARYLLFTGLALSSDGGDTFERYSRAPVLDRSDKELLVRSGACVIFHEGIWKAWYAAGSSFTTVGHKQVPTYHLAYVESPDGISWPPVGQVCMLPTAPDEYGFGRPSVVCEGGLYKMWYSSRTHSLGYRVRYATSIDGLIWDRTPTEGGVPTSATGWDADMTCFASVVDNGFDRFMFYNGNDYGKTGVGVAKLVSTT